MRHLSRTAAATLHPPATPRWWKYVNMRSLTCPCGHHIPHVARINETGFIRCNHWIGSEDRECGQWVFVLAIRGGRCVIAQVSLDEQDAMQELVTPAAMLDYLGIFEQTNVGR